MNFILRKHNRPALQITLPNGLRGLMLDMTREVLREQPPKMLEFIADYLDAMIVVRENAYIAQHVLDDLIQFGMDMSDLLKLAGLPEDKAKAASNYLQNVLQTITVAGSVTEFNENVIISELITIYGLCCKKSLKVKHIIAESFKGYFYRYISYHDTERILFGATWNAAVERTLDIYRQTKSDQRSIDRAAGIIQAAYRRFYERKRTKRIKAAIVIQKYFRGYQLRRLLSKSFGSKLMSRSKTSLVRSSSAGWISPFTSINRTDLSKQ